MRNWRTWIYGTNPNGTWGNLTWKIGVNTANLAYTGLCAKPEEGDNE